MVRAGGQCRPQILTELHAESELRHLRAAEQELRAEGHVRTGEAYHAQRVGCGIIMAQLVELAVVRQKGLGDKAEQTPAVHHCRAVIELAVHRDGQPDDGHKPKLCTGRNYLLQQSLSGALKRLLQEQIAAGVAGQPQLGEHGELHTVAVGAAHGRYCGFRIIRAVRHAKRRRQSAGLYKAVYHKSITLCV